VKRHVQSTRDSHALNLKRRLAEYDADSTPIRSPVKYVVNAAAAGVAAAGLLSPGYRRGAGEEAAGRGEAGLGAGDGGSGADAAGAAPGAEAGAAPEAAAAAAAAAARMRAASANESACVTCGVDDDHGVLCDGCDAVFHPSCVGLADVPEVGTDA